MFLVKVISQDRKTKVFVKASQLTELIAEAITKLKLSEDSYQVYQEDDGTLIDDDGVFEALCEEAKSQQQKLSVVLLPPNQAWSKSGEGSSRLERSLSESSGSSESSNLNSPSNSLLDSPQQPSVVTRGFPISSVSQFLDPVIEILDTSTQTPKHFPHLKKHAIKETFHTIGNHMIFRLKDYSKPTARILARCVLDYDNKKYARIFAIVIGGLETDSGHNAFAQQIYAFVQANKGEENVRKKGKKRIHEDGHDDPDDDLSPPAASRQDSYGCVAFEIPLPEGETAASQERKRVEAAAADPLSEEAGTLMSSTYASQRLEINGGKPMLVNLPKILDRWPLLKTKIFLIKHGQVLLGKDVAAVWNQSFTDKWKSLFYFLKNYFENPSRKGAQEMTAFIEDAERRDVASRSIESKCTLTFQLIVAFMKEEISSLFVAVNALSTDEDVLAGAAGAKGFPLLVLKGESLSDPMAEIYLVLVGKVALRVADPSEAVLVLILSYYIFNISYHPKLQSTLEFFQRFFLQVNPPIGNKHTKQRRTVDPIDAKVKSLASKLTDYSALWNVPPH